MTSLRPVWHWLALVLGCLLCRAGIAAGPHDFDYRISGDREARPVQVFADSERTYFQFVAGRPVPLILAGAGRERVVPMPEGPYHVVAGTASAYTLLLAGRQARVEHAGHVWSASDSTAGVPARRRGADDRTLSSYATPVRGDVIEWVEPEVRIEHSVVFSPGARQLPRAARDMIGRVSRQRGPDVRVELQLAASPRQQELWDHRVRDALRVLVASGVPAARIAVVQGPQPADTVSVVWRSIGPVTATEARLDVGGPRDSSHGRPVVGNFDILMSDRTVATSLRRWAGQSGYRLDWTTAIDAPVVGELTLDVQHFPEAVDRVISGLRASGYPLRMETGEGRVVRIRQEAAR